MRFLDASWLATGAAILGALAGCTTSAPRGSEGGVLACQQRSADGTDEDCVDAGKPRKLDCANKTEQAAAIGRGCASEHPEDPTELDVCCLPTVQGTRVDGG